MPTLPHRFWNKNIRWVNSVCFVSLGGHFFSTSRFKPSEGPKRNDRNMRLVSLIEKKIIIVSMETKVSCHLFYSSLRHICSAGVNSCFWVYMCVCVSFHYSSFCVHTTFDGQRKSIAHKYINVSIVVTIKRLQLWKLSWFYYVLDVQQEILRCCCWAVVISVLESASQSVHTA